MQGECMFETEDLGILNLNFVSSWYVFKHVKRSKAAWAWASDKNLL